MRLPDASSPAPRRRSGRGLTLVECMLALAVLSVALLAVVSTVTVGQQHMMAADHAMAASRLARDLLEEISAQAYQDPDTAPVFGPEPGETERSVYDDCDDYDGYGEAPGEARTAAGELYEGNQSVFGRKVSVVAETQTIEGLGASVPGLRVTVDVADQNGQTWQYSRFIPEPPR